MIIMGRDLYHAKKAKIADQNSNDNKSLKLKLQRETLTQDVEEIVIVIVS